jgi:hypothetical protein
MKLVVAGVLLSLALGCSPRTIPIRQPLSSEDASTVNAALGGRDAKVKLADGTTQDVKQPVVGVEVTRWLERQPDTVGLAGETEMPRTVPTAALGQVSFNDRERGRIIGTVAGALTAIAISAALIISATSCTDQRIPGCSGIDCPCATSDFGRGAGLILGVPVAGLLGALVGFGIGSTAVIPTTIRFESATP